MEVQVPLMEFLLQTQGSFGGFFCLEFYILRWSLGNRHCTKTAHCFPLRIYLVNVAKSVVSADLITFTEKILNGKLHFLCSEDFQSSFFLFLADKMRNSNVFLRMHFGMCFCECVIRECVSVFPTCF